MTDTENRRYAIPAGVFRNEEEIERSRFITTLTHAETVRAAKSFVARMRAEFPDASHNCWAYLIGTPGVSMTNAQVKGGVDG
jgi:putative IMPACT (imprinted ancient) family translation regulator